MEKLFVEFTDSTASKINSVFGCQQDDEQFPNQGVVLADARGGKSTFLGCRILLRVRFPGRRNSKLIAHPLGECICT